jgi:cytochrome c oxidase subunit III
MTTENIPLSADLHGGGPADDKQTHISQATLAMLLFLGSEAMLFASFFTAYFMVRFNIAGNVWPPINPATGHKYVLPVAITGVNTLFLVSSSFTLWWGEYRLQHGGDRKSLERGLLVTMGLGFTFLTIQLNEYAHLGFSPRDQAFGSTFYSLTGLHGLHVIVGLCLLTICFVRSRRRHEFTAERASMLWATSLYWHFVDVVWVILFFLVYLL